MFKKILKQNLRLTLTIFFCLNISLLFAQSAYYKFGWAGQAPDDAVIKITAMFSNGAVIDKDIPVGGLTVNEAAEIIYSGLQGHFDWNLVGGIFPDDDPTDQNRMIIIYGLRTPDQFPIFNPVKEVDISDNAALINTWCGGVVFKSQTKVGVPHVFDLKLLEPQPNSYMPGTLKLKLNELILSIVISASDSIETIASNLSAACISAGVIHQLNGNVISVDWDDPLNDSIMGEEVQIESGIEYGAGGPHIVIGIPELKDDIINIPTLSQWGLIVMTSLLLLIGSLGILRKV
ncbi:MAG TPA: IPTL-CTERM sorting domain-containing protein [Bacteroidales bacterium]|nr:IPTL-CTERM sorting domain-containing protein [Bacteroidales bacterium]HSA43879.1 IPTL-CTERM sorting domain-containing protein [Bacteroidales bacterium]